MESRFLVEGISSPEELLARSQSLELAGEMVAALDCARLILKTDRAQAEPEWKATALERMAFLHYRMADYKESEDLARQALEIAPEDAPTRVRAWITLGLCACETGTVDDTEIYLLKAADLSRKIGDEILRMRALHNLGGFVYLLRGQFDLSLAAIEEAYRIAKTLALPQSFAPLLVSMHAYLLMGQHQKARELLPRCHIEAQGKDFYLGLVYLFSGVIALAEGDFQSTLEQLLLVRRIAEKTGEPALNIFYRITMSQYNRHQGRGPQACEWANDAVHWASRISSRRFLGRTLVERGRAYWANNELQKAEQDLQASIIELGDRRQIFDQAKARFYLAALLHQVGSPSVKTAWEEAARAISAHGYYVILDQDQSLVNPLFERFSRSSDKELAALTQRCVEGVQRYPPPVLTIKTFRELAVEQGVRQLSRRALRQRKSGELLVLLIFSPQHSLEYEQVVEALWPERDPASTRTLFHHACASLRQALEPNLPDFMHSRYLSVEEGTVKLSLPNGSKVDALLFEEHVKNQHWQEALALYRVEFLPEFLYADWTQALRRRLAILAEEALLSQARIHFQQGSYHEVIDLVIRLIQIEPWHEEGVLLGMQAYLASGDRGGALRLFHDLKKALETDLGVLPSDDLQQLFQQITHGYPD